jgi:hypothetical protein
MISVMLDVVGAALLLIGLTLMTVGLVGVLRQPDTYSQLHAQGLATGPGVIAVLASSVATENAAIITGVRARHRPVRAPPQQPAEMSEPSTPPWASLPDACNSVGPVGRAGHGRPEQRPAAPQAPPEGELATHTVTAACCSAASSSARP